MCARAGLAAQALDLGITPDEAGAGLVPPAVAIAYMGNFGGILILTMLFMARTTPACSSSLAVGLAPNTRGFVERLGTGPRHEHSMGVRSLTWLSRPLAGDHEHRICRAHRRLESPVVRPPRMHNIMTAVRVFHARRD